MQTVGKPRLVLDSTICGMNGRCHLPERQRLPNLRHIYFFLSSCAPLQEEWQGASIDIKAAHKRMLIREDERGSLLFKYWWPTLRISFSTLWSKNQCLALGSSFWSSAKTSTFFFVLQTCCLGLCGWFLSPFPEVNFGNSIHFWPSFYFALSGHLYPGRNWNSTKRLDWNGWTIQPATMIAQLPSSKQEKTNSLIKTVLQSPCRKNLEKIIGILLWATSFVHHVRFLLTSLYRDLYSIPATNYSIAPTEWESFLNLLNDCATITTHNHLHLPIGSRVVEFKHNSISSNSQLPRDVPIERHVWIRLRDPNCDKRRLSDASKETLL